MTDISATTLIISEVSTVFVNALLVYTFLQRFSTKAEVRRVEKDARERIDAVEQRLTTNLNGLEQRLTRDIHDNRAGNEHRFGELGAKFDNLSNTVQVFANEMNRVVGHLEARNALMEKLMGLKQSGETGNV